MTWMTTATYASWRALEHIKEAYTDSWRHCKLPAIYNAADILVLASSREGWPNVLLEALACGTPALASNVGGVPEIAIDDESALLVPAHDPQLFANALRRILTDADLAHGIRANAKVRALHFSPEAYARSLISIYEDLASATLRQPRSGLMNLARSFKAG